MLMRFYQRLLDQCVPYIVARDAVLPTLDLTPLGITIQPEHIFDPMRAASGSFIDLVKRIEKRDIHDREIQDQAREKLKKRKAKDDAESGDNHGDNASRSDKNKNGKGKKSRRNEDSPSNAGKAKFCQLCKLAGAPEFVYKTHNTKDCRKKEKYERLLSGGVASRSNATKEYKKELRALNKKYKKAKKEAREYRAMKKQSSNGKLKRKYDSSDDESDDDTSVSSSDTNVSY